MTEKEKTYTRLTPVFAVAAFFFGLAFVLSAGQVAGIAEIRKTWKPVQGQVARVDPNGWWDDDANQRYYLEYRYAVDGKTYTGVRYHVQERSLKTYAGIEYRYRTGDAITVYVDPDDPGQAVLDVSYLRDSFLALAVLGGFLVLAGTLFVKERDERRRAGAVAASDEGRAPLPDLPGVSDRPEALRLDTGMSLFWRVGMPFVIVCFAGIAPGLFLLEETHPSWGLGRYLGMVLAIWIAAAAAGVAVTRCFSFTLVVDRVKKEIREEIRLCFFQKSVAYGFSRISELRLYREKWRQDNPLRNWIMFVQTDSGRSVTVSRGFRDFQPADSVYLGAVKRRIEHLVFNGANTGGRR